MFLQPELTVSDGHLLKLRSVGLGILRYGLVFTLVLWGGFKFFEFEAEAIRPFIEHSPLLSWLYGVLGTRKTSALIGVIEIAAGLLIAVRPWFPRTSGLASLASSAMFLVTLSFLFTTPGVLIPPSETGGFLMKDLFLLGAALYTAAEALLASPRPNRRRGSPT
jgi:reactive chlorine resistance protein C